MSDLTIIKPFSGIFITFCLLFSSCAKSDEIDVTPTVMSAVQTHAKSYSESEYFYYYGGQKQFLELDTRHAFISMEDKSNAALLDSMQISYQPLNADITSKKSSKDIDKRYWTKLDFGEKMPKDNYLEKLSKIKRKRDVIVAPYFKNGSQDNIGLSNFLYVKLKFANDVALLTREVEKEKAIIVQQNEYMPLWYVISITEESNLNAMELANRFYELGVFECAEPDLLVDDCTTAPNDPYYNQQWALNNTGQYAGVQGIDINSEQAWVMSTGTGVTVAVLDQGIDMSHPDLVANIHPLSYDSESGASSQKVLGNHGTAVAGIIGAVRNNAQGIAGVAPDAKIMSISNSMAAMPLSREKRANGINWAAMNGADIINNSWGSSAQHTIIDDAITNAILNGRGGKGCIIVFSTGNEYQNSVGYPANSHPGIIAVGAIQSNGNRAEFSNYGSALDVVAPGGSRSIYTTDRQSFAGYSSNDYYPYFDGTSAAAPHVAGVAALILSKNPDLTQKQVADIIETTAQQNNLPYTFNVSKPNGMWNNEVGYGLVDAYAALVATPAPVRQSVEIDVFNDTDMSRNITLHISGGEFPLLMNETRTVTIAPNRFYSTFLSLKAGNYSFRVTESSFIEFSCLVNTYGSVNFSLNQNSGSPSFLNTQWEVHSTFPGTIFPLPPAVWSQADSLAMADSLAQPQIAL